jgi:hypothetical protein
MFLIVSRFLIPKKIAGLTLYPFVILKNKSFKNNATIINHEKIHLKQQLELLIIPFYLWYLIEFLIRWAKCKNKSMAYLNICFEKEAYANELNNNYLEERKFWQFLKYFK